MATSMMAAVVVIVILAGGLAYAAYSLSTATGQTTTSTSVTTVTKASPTTITSTLPTTITTASPTTITATSSTTVTATSTSTLVSSSTATVTTTSTSTSIALAPLLSYSADAYSTETTALLTGFSKATGTPVAPVVSGGSGADATAIATGAPDDVFISASLGATAPGSLKGDSSNWAIGFATDQMVIAYSNATVKNSVAATMITQGQTAATSNATSDWNTFFTSLTSGTVKVGISNPVADPGGLRGWLVLEAAGYLYSGGSQQAYASSLLKTGSNVTAASAAALVAPLVAGQIQFLFIYKSAAVGAGVGYLQLNNHVNLASPSLASFYSKFSYTDSAGTTAGAPIVLVVTVPLSSVNTTEALEFVQYLVKNAPGLSSYGLVIPTPLLLYSSVTAPQTLPPAVQQLVTQGLVVAAGPI